MPSVFVHGRHSSSEFLLHSRGLLKVSHNWEIASAIFSKLRNCRTGDLKLPGQRLAQSLRNSHCEMDEMGESEDSTNHKRAKIGMADNAREKRKSSSSVGAGEAGASEQLQK